VPDWAESGLRQAHAPWPEDDEQWELTIADEHGCQGRYGGFSSVVLQIIRLQIAPAMTKPFSFAACGGAEQVPTLGRHRRGSHFRIAVSVVDLALWDLVAHAAAEPASPAGCVPAYASALGFEIHHPVAPSLAAWLTEQGFGLQKWRLSGEMERARDDIARCAEIGAAAGGAARVAVDGVASWPADYASLVVPELAAIGIGWIEEPVAGGVEELAPLAGPGVRLGWGEHAYDPQVQRAAMKSGFVDVWQPDVGWCGGLTAAIGATRVAHQHGIPVYPHGGSLVAGCALAAWCGADAVPAVEYHLTQEPWRQRFARRPLVPAAGRVLLADVTAARELRVSRGHRAIDICAAA
jgi:L-alanine-DL-glutamate epimerase-like enolase superfamily enzyme